MRSIWLGFMVLWMLLCSVAKGQEIVTLGWDPETNSPVAGYMVSYGPASRQYTVTKDMGTNTVATIFNLQWGSNYYFSVTSYLANGTQSTPSDELFYSVEPSLFFRGQASVTTIVRYLVMPTGNLFGYYDVTGFPSFYHYDMGYEYLVEAYDGAKGVYLYDVASRGFWYTNPKVFPYVYDFALNAWLYYYPDPNRADHYTSNPRVFFNFGTGKIITR